MKSSAKRTKSPVKRTRSPAKHEETMMRGRCPACIYARNRPRFVNLPKMSNPDTKLLEKYFSHFTKNFRMPNLYVKLLEMLEHRVGWLVGTPTFISDHVVILHLGFGITVNTKHVRDLDNFLHSLISKNNDCMVMTCMIINDCSIASYIFT
jgi:hypothetical protein